MTATLESLRSLGVHGLEADYGDKETLLYALSLGLGDDASAPGAMRYLSEIGGELRAMPTLACVLARTPLLKDSGIDFARMLHGEQRLQLHRRLPTAGRLSLDARVTSVIDLGTAKGALVCVETVGRVAGEPPKKDLFTSQSLLFCRGNGGIGSLHERPRPLAAVPTVPPDLVMQLPTRSDQALLYRLNGDRNPIHVDPVVARDAGLARPLLHGLCTFGMCARAVLRALDWDGDCIEGFELRFAAPFYPGETLEVDLWLAGQSIAFQARSGERDVVVASHGNCRLRPRA